MKKLICFILCFGLLGAAKVNAAETGSIEILETLWAKVSPQERFSVYGGMMARPAEDGPGVLDLSEKEELEGVYRLPVADLEKMAEGASLVHLLNRNVFTAAVVKIPREADFLPVFHQWRDNIQRNHWIGGRPERVLLARVEGSYLLMVLGTREAMKNLQSKLTQSYPSTEILYSQAVTG